jgi:hypothetical protein
VEEPIALIAPAWTYGLAVIALVLFGAAMATLACWALGVGREVKRAHERIDEHEGCEHAGPVGVRFPRPCRT